ncbi:MAG: GNAT family N-acetyltransferase [Microthrixaceae bacterium]
MDALIRSARRSPSGWILAFCAAGATGALVGLVVALVGGWPTTVLVIVGAAIGLLVVGRALTRPSPPIGLAADLDDPDAGSGSGPSRVRLRHFGEIDAATGAVEATIDDEVVRWQGWSEHDAAHLRHLAADPARLRESGFLAVSDPGDDRVLGVVSLTAPPTTPGLAWFGIWLAPEARGHGLATETIRRTAALSWRCGADAMTMGTDAANTPMVRSFVAAGASLSETTPHVLPDGRQVDSVWYRLEAPGPAAGDDVAPNA